MVDKERVVALNMRGGRQISGGVNPLLAELVQRQKGKQLLLWPWFEGKQRIHIILLVSWFNPKSETVVTVIYIHRNFRNCRWRKPLLGEAVLQHHIHYYCTSAQSSLSQALDGGQLNDSAACCNPGPYWITSGVWLKVYSVTCILSNTSMQWISCKQLSPISQALCFELPLHPISSASATTQGLCNWPQIYQVLFVKVGKTTRQMLLIPFFCSICSNCEETKEKNFNMLRSASINYIPFETAKQFLRTMFYVMQPFNTNWCELRLFSQVLNLC